MYDLGDICIASVYRFKNEGEMLSIKNLFNNGGSLELAIATFQNISEDVIHRIYEEVMDKKITAKS